MLRETAPVLRSMQHSPIIPSSGTHSDAPLPPKQPEVCNAPRACARPTPHCPTITPGLHSPTSSLHYPSRPPAGPGAGESPPPELVLTLNVCLLLLGWRGDNIWNTWPCSVRGHIICTQRSSVSTYRPLGLSPS